MTSLVLLLVFTIQLITGTNAQFSFDVQSDINIGLQVGVSIIICIITILTLVGIINLLKFKVLGKSKNAQPTTTT